MTKDHTKSGGTLGKRAFSETSRSVRTATVKYKSYEMKEDPVQTKTLPSQLLQQLSKPPTVVSGSRAKPRIIELLNIADYTHHVDCTVDMDEPLFQPFPPEVSFFEYEPFHTYESVLTLRNNDRAARRVKVLPPASPYFSVTRVPKGGIDSDEGTKVAYGMEVTYLITFKPDSFDDYHHDLVVCTEREKFLVPILARGRRAALDLPDTIEFDATPARGASTQSFVVTNVGQRRSSFTFSTTGPFGIRPSEGALGPGESLQCTLSFEPPSVGEYHGELIAQYDTGEEAYANLIGYGAKLDVSLSTEQVQLLPTFLTKMSQRTFRIVNGSSRPVEFSWKKAPSADKEAETSRLRLDTLTTQETLGTQQEGLMGLGYGEDEADGSSDEEERLLTSKLATASQTFKRMRRDVQKDLNLFEDPAITLSPLSGVIGPNGEVEVTVQFRPTFAQEYQVKPYLEITGLGHRLPLLIKGRGMGPKAMFSFDVLDVGETFVNTLHQYQIELHNRGEIDTSFNLLPLPTPFGKRFSFSPASGALPAGKDQVVDIQFLSTELGSFNETFRCEIAGSLDPITVEFKGRVVGPSFAIDTDELTFGTVAFGFRYSRSFHLRNTSEVPLRYALRVPADAHKEFHVTPAQGIIPPHGSQETVLEIEAKRVTLYNLELAVDVIGVGHNVKSVPITAESAVPAVALDSGGVDFGECYLHYPVTRTLEIKNLHPHLPAKFDALPQDEQSTTLGTVTVSPATGEIEPRESSLVEVTLTPLRKGRVQLPLRFFVHGAGRDPLECMLVANAVGPLLTFEDESGHVMPAPLIDFGQKPVLRRHCKVLRVRNSSPIQAEFKCFCEGVGRYFSVEPREKVLAAGEAVDLKLSVQMDDCLPFKDVLHILITDGDDVNVPLRAAGSGTTVVIEDLDAQQGVVDLGAQFVGRTFSRDFALRNMSHRPQSITWIALTKEQILRQKTRAPRRNEEGEIIEVQEPEIVFAITPERANLGPGQKLEVTVSGTARDVGSKAEKFLLRTNVGKVNFDVATLEMRAEVGQPLLSFSHPKGINFQYWYEPLAPSHVLSETLEIANQSQLPLSFNLKAPPPFLIDRPDWSLDPGASCAARIFFDPAFRNDRQSTLIKSKLAISYLEAPQKDALDLVADVNFPNLQLDTAAVDFSSVLIDTVRRRHVTIKNVSKVPCRFSWSFLEILREPLESTDTQEGGAARLKPSMTTVSGSGSPAQSVDILPLSGELAPGQSETVEFCFFAHAGTKLDAVAVCEVQGGPEYEVKLTGEASTVKYSLDTNLIDIGSVPYDKVIEKDVVLQNLGRVPFEWRVNLAKVTRPGVVTVSPALGSLGPNQKETLRMRIKAGVPDRLSEVVLVEVAHCESEQVAVVGEGVYPSCVLTLPRQPDEDFAALLEEAKQRLVTRGPQTGLGVLKTGVGFAAGLKDGLTLRTAATVSPTRAVSRTNSQQGMLAGPASAFNRNSTFKGSRPTTPNRRGPTEGASPLFIPEYNPTSAEIEVEADRLKLCHVLTMHQLAKSAPPAPAAQPSAVALPANASLVSVMGRQALNSAGSTSGALLGPEASVMASQADVGATLRQEPSTTTAASKPVSKNNVSYSSVAHYVKATGKPVAGHYVLDFGFITKGTTRTKKFRLQNTSTQPLYFSIDKKVLSPANLIADPEAVSKLPGAPEYASVSVAFTFNTTKSSVQPGPVSCFVPLEVRGGPTVMIQVKAVVVVPELRISREVLDFGAVQSGLCKIITLQLHNPKDVACEWSVRKPTEGVQDWSYFQLHPEGGTIPPNGRINVKAIFTPSRGKERNYSQRIPLRINYNARQITLVATGSASCPRAQLSQSVLDLGPIIPKFEGQTPKKAAVELFNPSPQPIEVFCVETDAQYREEEELLRTYNAFEAQGTSTIMLPVRAPGAPFWPEIVAAKKTQDAEAAEELRTAAAAEASHGEVATGGLGSRQSSQPGSPSKPGRVSDGGSALSGFALVGDLETAQQRTPMYFLVLGDEGIATEKHEIVKGLEKRYGLTTVTVESLISSLRTRETLPEGVSSLLAEDQLDEEQLAAVLTEALSGPESPLEHGLVVSSVKSSYAAHDTGLRALLKALGLRPVEDTKAEVAAAAGAKGGKPPAKGKGKEEPPPVTNEVHEMAWEGERLVRTILVTLDQAEFTRRRRITLATSQIGGTEEANSPPPALSASPSRAISRTSTSALSPPGTTGRGTNSGNSVSPRPSAAADRASLSGAAQAVEGGQEAALEEQILQEWKEHSALYRKLTGLVTAPASPAHPSRIELISTKAVPTATGTDLFNEIVGFQWTRDKLTTRLPGVDADKFLPPPDYFMQVVHRPVSRLTRPNNLKHFKVFTLPEGGVNAAAGARPSIGVERGSVAAPPSTAGKTPAAKGKGGKEDPGAAGAAGQAGGLREQTRWVIPPRGTVHLEVHFQSSEIGNFTENLTFEVVDGLADAHPTLTCTGSCSYPSISKDYRNVFYKKVKAKPAPQAVSKQYIIATDTFDFGPLLFISKKPEKDYQTVGQQNPDCFTKMRITNSGSFDASVEFKLKSTGKALGGVFAVFPEAMELKVEETQELMVFAFPTAEGTFEDQLECLIKDNPHPTTFHLACTGAKPHLKVEGPDAKGTVAFERLLLGKKEHKQLTLSNSSLLPLVWELEGVDKLPPEVTVSLHRGDLPAMTDQPVLIQFSALDPKAVTVPLKLRVFDAKKSQPALQDVPITVQGEAFELKIKPTFPDADPSKQAVDFGTLRVVEDREREISLENTGKYPVGFRFVFAKGSPLRDLITILGPDAKPLTGEGQVDPGKKVAVKLHFNRSRSLAREVSIRDNYDLSLQYIEKLTNTVEQRVPIKVDAVAVFSKYSITPARGLSFGPTTYKTQSKPRVFEVQNLGVFPFDFRAFDTKNPPAPEDLASVFARPGTASGGKKDDKGKGGKKDDKKDGAGPSLTVGPFVVEPGMATIQPGTTLQVKVTFNAEGDRSYQETLGLHISERDLEDHPGGLLYELSGDSCIPGINALDVDTIFEEHRLLNSFNPFNPTPLAFYKRERLFDFGPVVATLSESPAEGAGAAAPAAKAPPAKPAALPKSPPVEDEDEKSRGVRANLRISNPTKVPCSVQFSIQPRGEAAGFPMTVSPGKVDIPPHEYRYISVRFAPSAIQSYAAIFEAKVENGGDPKTASFQCELRGEGVLPHVTVVEPSARTQAGRPVLKFSRLLVGREQTLPLFLRNDGSLPASFRLDSPPNAAFRITGGPAVGTLEPRTGQEYQVTFAPKSSEALTHGISLVVKHNPFEKVVIDCTGEGYREDVIFEGLPGEVGEADVLHLPDTAVGEQVRVAFNLRNLSNDKVFRFNWIAETAPAAPEPKGSKSKGAAAAPPAPAGGLPPGLELSPSVGHLHPGASKLIVATFKPAAKVAIKEQPVSLKIEEIALADANADDWDDKAVLVEFEDDGTERTRAKEEPKFTPSAGTGKNLTLKVTAAADLSRYQCDTTPIAFKPTMMFQTRTFSFPLKNLGEARMPFSFEVQRPDGTPDPDGFYSVEPASGEIDAGKEATITVKFSPTEVEDCTRQLACHIPYLAEGMPPLVRPLTGRVQRPWCHMELPESDYLSSGRRNPEMKGPSGSLGPLDPATRVLEFESLGFRIRNTKRFFVLNPTSIAYEFVWERVVLPDEKPSPFRTQTVRGSIAGGKRFEMVFDYTPEEDELREAHWTFRIPEQNISVPFLLVGNVKEPAVTLDKSAINFEMIQVGAKGRETLHLVNGEDLPFTFVFDKASYDATEQRVMSTGKRPLLEFEPYCGTIAPKSSFPITVTYTPTEEAAINYNVIVNVKKKPSRLTLNVKGEGFVLKDQMSIAAADGLSIGLAPSVPNPVDLGRVLINERAVRQVSIVNSGSVNLEFQWNTGENPRVSVRPDTGKVRKGERFVCELAYSPQRPETLDNYLVSCQIVNGHRYHLRLKGEGHKPRLSLSWYQQDFGPTLVYEPGMPEPTVFLRARNDDLQEISFNFLWEDRPHLKVRSASTILAPGESKDIPVVFTPDRLGKFEEAIPLEINGLYTVNLLVKGEGVPLKLELIRGGAEASTSGGLPVVNLGSLRVGGQSSKIVKLANRGRCPVTFSLLPAAEALARHNVEVIPMGDITLRARDEVDLTFFFRPAARIRPFADEIVARVHGIERKVMVLSGACLGTELKLATDNLPFGAVVLGSRVAKRVQLENTGDVGTKFAWDTRVFGPHFEISPSEGFLAPNQDIKLEVTFKPLELSPDIRVDRLRLSVEGGDDKFLTLTGSCIAQEPQGEVVNFTAPVREETTQSITLKNTTSTDWSLRPVITNDFWSGPEFVSVRAGQSAPYALTYRPMLMATRERPHEGSVFFPLPDGTGLLYRLVGAAEAPLPAGSIDKQLQAKQVLTTVLKVKNWDKKAQRFQAIVEMAPGAPKSAQITAAEHVDVPGLSERDFKVQTVTYVEGKVQARIVFKSTSTGEYLFYDTTFTASRAAVRDTLRLECPVRQLAIATVRVDNPLGEEVTLDAKCSDAQVQVPAQVALKPRSQQDVEVRYRPLLVGDKEATLTLQCADLGVFEYKLQLRGAPTGSERGLEFNVPLGSSETKRVRYTNWFEGKTEYACSFKDRGAAGFTSEAKVASLKAGAELGVDVTFEPTAIGDQFKDVLVLTSPEGGVFEFPVVGRCLPPKPKGPVDLRNGAGSVPFKNVFAKDKDFVYSVDNPAFTVKPGELIKAKGQVTIAVSFKEVPGQPRSAKLTITCPDVTVPWIFYLRA